MCAENQFGFENPDSSTMDVSDTYSGTTLDVPLEYTLWQDSNELDDMQLTGRELVEILDELILERDNNANIS